MFKLRSEAVQYCADAVRYGTCWFIYIAELQGINVIFAFGINLASHVV